mgnify:CR=1 FL=1
MKKISKKILLSVSLVALLGACSENQEASAPERAAAVDAEVVVASNTAAPSRPSRDAVARASFETNCASCHGKDLSGGRAHSLFEPHFLSEKSDQDLQVIIAEGIEDAGMPSFAGMLTDSEVLQILTFMRNESVNFAEHPVFVPSPDGFEIESDKQTFVIEVLASGLDVPWGLVNLPDGRILVTERAGRIRILENEQLLESAVSGTPEVVVGQDAGMFDIALHPDYANNGWIYLSYAERLAGFVTQEKVDGERPANPPSMTVIVRGKLSAQNEWVESEELFRASAELYTSSGSHFGSRFVFDDAGHLFFSIGERGEMANAQDLSNPLGKIHRINDDGSVPTDNPFVGVANAVDSIWTYGHRNPQGLSFDPNTGLLWEAEHGPTGGDEINIIEKGKNYGWGVISMGLERGISQVSAPGMEQPVTYYTPTLAPSGIAFYKGERYPEWNSSLFVAGLAGQQLLRLEIDGRDVVEQEVLFDQFGRTRAVIVGNDGLLYAVLQNPTGADTGLRLSDPTPGILIRLTPSE